MKKFFTPQWLDKLAENFTGLALNTLETLVTQKKLLLCRPEREKVKPAAYSNPGIFLSYVDRILPSTTKKEIYRVFPASALLRQAEPRTALGLNAEYRWCDFIVYARKNLKPTFPETLEPIWHFYMIRGHGVTTQRDAVEIIDNTSDSRHLLIGGATEDPQHFSNSVIHYLVAEELAPRLDAVYATEDPEGGDTGSPSTFGVGATACHDFTVRSIVVCLPIKN